MIAKVARVTIVGIDLVEELPPVGPSLLRDTLLRTNCPRSTAFVSSLSGSTGAPMSSSSLSINDNLFLRGFLEHGRATSSYGLRILG